MEDSSQLDVSSVRLPATFNNVISITVPCYELLPRGKKEFVLKFQIHFIDIVSYIYTLTQCLTNSLWPPPDSRCKTHEMLNLQSMRWSPNKNSSYWSDYLCHSLVWHVWWNAIGLFILPNVCRYIEFFRSTSRWVLLFTAMWFSPLWFSHGQ